MMKEKRETKALPNFFVGKQLTRQRIKKFLDTRYKALCEKAPNHGETRSIWYSREHFAGLLEEIDRAGGNGIKISFGVYEEEHDFAHQMCLLFNVTCRSEKDGNSNNQTVFMEDQKDFKMRFSMYQKKRANEDFNLGHPCPPRCDDGGLTGGSDL